MERWGTELWDRWDAVVEQVTAGTQEMATVYARFLNDRAKVGHGQADICSCCIWLTMVCFCRTTMTNLFV